MPSSKNATPSSTEYRLTTMEVSYTDGQTAFRYEAYHHEDSRETRDAFVEKRDAKFD